MDPKPPPVSAEMWGGFLSFAVLSCKMGLAELWRGSEGALWAASPRCSSTCLLGTWRLAVGGGGSAYLLPLSDSASQPCEPASRMARADTVGGGWFSVQVGPSLLQRSLVFSIPNSGRPQCESPARARQLSATTATEAGKPPGPPSSELGSRAHPCGMLGPGTCSGALAGHLAIHVDLGQS